MKRVRFTIIRTFAVAFALMLVAPAFSASAQTETTYGHATFYTPTGESVPGALLTVTTVDGKVLRQTTSGVNDSVIWLSPPFVVGTEYCLYVDATALGYQPWYGCEITDSRRLHFDVYLEPIVYGLLEGSVSQNGNELPVADATVCIEEVGLCTVTDASGRFSFGDVLAGTYNLSVTTEGYKPQSASVTVTEDGAWVDVVQYKGNGKPGNGNN